MALFCDICKINIQTQDQVDPHYSGKKHLKNILKQQEDRKCDICNVKYSSLQHEKIHIAGRKHSKRMQIKQDNPENDLNNLDTQEQRNSTFCTYCEVCEVPLSSKETSNFHYAGKRHQRNLIEMQVGKHQLMNTSNVKTVVFNTMTEFKTSVKSSAVTPTGNNLKESYFGSHKVMCGLCMIQLGSIRLSEVHFNSYKHMKKEVVMGRGKEFDFNKWCPVCMVALSCQITATAHCHGEQHKLKLTLAQDIGVVDRQTIEQLRPENVLHAYLQQSPPRAKRSLVKVDADYGADYKEPPIKKGHFKLLQQLLFMESSFDESKN